MIVERTSRLSLNILLVPSYARLLFLWRIADNFGSWRKFPLSNYPSVIKNNTPQFILSQC